MSIRSLTDVNFHGLAANGVNYSAIIKSMPLNQPSPIIEDDKPDIEESSSITDWPIDFRLDMIFKFKIYSKFDHKVEINLTTWAVTVAIDKNSFHARIVTEGVKENIGPFFQISHLQGPKTWRAPKEICNCFFGWSKSGKVRFGDWIPLNKLRVNVYRSKSQTWDRPREKVELMLDSIDKESTSTRPVPFSFFGSRSLLTKEVEFFETDHPKLRQMLERDPVLFSWLFHLSSQYFLYRQDKIKWTLNNGDFVLKFLLNLYHNIIAKAAPEEGFRKRSLEYSLMTIFVPASIPSMLYDIKKEFDLNLNFFLTRRMARKGWALDLMKDHVKRVVQIPNSCYTWTEEKLTMIGVEMPQGTLDKFITVSTLYANMQIESSEESKVSDKEEIEIEQEIEVVESSSEGIEGDAFLEEVKEVLEEIKEKLQPYLEEEKAKV